MEKHIKKLNEQRYDDSFNKTSMWLIKSNYKISQRKNQRRLIKMKNYFLRHKIQFVTILLMAIMIAACNMPVTQNDTVGYILSWTTNSTSNKVVSESLNKLNWYKNSSITTDVKSINGNEIFESKLVVQSKDDKAVLEYKNDLERIDGLTSIKILPLNESVTRPVYSAALNSFFKIDINASKLSEEEVQKEISKQLEEAGFNDMIVSYKKDVNGKTRLELKLKDGIKNEKGKSLEVNVNDNNGQQVVKMNTSTPDVDFSKMSDEEIRTYIKNKNRENNLSDKDIIIVRDGSNVNVKVEKEEIK